MAQEEHTLKCSNSSSGGGGGDRSSKKLKQKKVPQRGLGVAQLEKIRLEEQQKKDAVIQAAAMLSSNSLVSPSNSSCLAVQSATNFRCNPTPSAIPLPLQSPTDLSSPNSIFRSASSNPNIDVLHLNPVSLPKPSKGSGEGETGWPAISGLGQSNWPKLWNGDHNLEGENHRLDHQGFAFRSNMNLPYESNPIWPPPNAMQRTQQFQQQPSSFSMVNVSSGTSSSSVPNYHQMEPPSNQSYYGNNYIPMWPGEEKMVGMKRPYPFSLGNPPGPAFPCKFPPTSVPPITRSDESASFGNGGTVNVELSNPVFREGPSSSTAVMSELNPNKLTKENGYLNGDFLTLAPPTTALPHPSSKYKHPSVHRTPHIRELSEFGSLQYQGSADDSIHRPGPSGFTQQQPFYSFFPSAKARIGPAATTVNSYSGEVGENLDLNLKL